MADSTLSASERQKENWMNSKWRPMMGWMYMGVCIFDFVIAPILWSIVQAHYHGVVSEQWQPLTLQGAGLFHLAMGAILGISAFGRTQEKIAGANTGGFGGFGGPVGTTYIPPTGINSQGGFANASTTPTTGYPGGSTAFGSTPTGFGAPSNSFGAPNTTAGTPPPAFGTPPPAFGSKPIGPPPAPMPPI